MQNFVLFVSEEKQEERNEKETTEDSYLHPSLLATSLNSVGLPICQLNCNVSVVSVFRYNVSLFYIITTVLFVYDLHLWVINKHIVFISSILFPIVVITY